MTFRHFYLLLVSCFFFFQNTIFSQNNALQFDGTTGEAKSAAAVQAVNFQRFTIESWVKLADSPTDPTDAIAGIGSLTQPLIWIWYDRTGVQFAQNSVVVGFFDGSAAVNFSHVFDFQPNIWTHLAASFNGNTSPKTLDLYLDGVLAASFAPTSNPANWLDERAFLGKIPGSTLPGNHLAGALDDVRIWKTNRTAAQILANKNTELVGTEANLWNYYKLNGGPCDARDCAGEDQFLKKTGSLTTVAGPTLTVNPTCPASGCAAPMSGIFTVGGTVPDFSTIQLAINALAVRGAADSVFFHLRPGVFDETFLTQPFLGFSQNTPVIFKKEPGTVGAVEISGNQFAVRVRNANNYHFQNLTFGKVVQVDSCQRTKFLDCTFQIPTGGTGVGWGNLGDSLTIENCLFSNGKYGMNMVGIGKQIKIIGNEFQSQSAYGISASGAMEDILIEENHFVQLADSFYFGISLDHIERAFRVLKNHIEVATGQGIHIHFSNQHASRSLVAGNFIRKTAGGYGIEISLGNRTDFLHNTVILNGSGACFYFASTQAASQVIKNNLFLNTGTGVAISVFDGQGLSSCNYNLLYSHGQFLAHRYYSSVGTLAEWQSYGYDLNSISVNPYLVSTANPTPQNPLCNNSGNMTPGIPEIQNDYFGNTRNAPPDPGTAEFTPPPPAQMCGNYTVGGTLPDFADPESAVNSLKYNGMSCPVTFDIRAGIYSKPVDIQNVAKANADDPIVFRRDPAAAAGTAVTLQGSHFVAKVVGVPAVHFENINFQQVGTIGSSCVVFRAKKGVFKGCSIVDSHFSSLEIDRTCDSLRVDSCRMVGYDRAVLVYNSPSNDTLKNLTIENSYFEKDDDYYGAFYIDGMLKDFIFQKNTVRGGGVLMPTAGATTMKILNNRFYSPFGLNISIAGLAPPAGQEVLIANNFFTSKTTGTVPALKFSNCKKINFYHNNVATVSGSSGAVVTLSGSQNRLKNNIFSSKHDCPVLSAATGSLLLSDYNDLFSTGATLAIFGATNCQNLSTWQTASNRDAHSVSANPEFYSFQNLRPDAAALDNAGNFIAGLPEITTDLEGAARVSPPDIGAVQFVPGSIPALCGTYKIGGAAPDFLNMENAAEHLNASGMDCPLVFEVWPGDYLGVFALTNIQKAEPTDAITIRREPGQTAATTFSSPGKIIQTSDVAFQNLNLKQLEVNNSARFEAKKCVFSNPGLDCIGNGDSLHVDSCTFLSLANFKLRGGTALAKPENGVVENCQFFQSGDMIFVQDSFDNLTIRKNIFTKNEYYGDCNGIRLNNATGNVRIYQNRFLTANDFTTFPLVFNNSKPSAGRSLVANNFFAGGKSSISNSARLDIFHNAFKSNTTVLAILGGSKHRIFNNILKNENTGTGNVALQISAVAVLDSFDFNNYSSASNSIAQLGGTFFPTFAAWQTATGREAHGFSVNPYFVSATNLAVQNSALDMAGFAVPGIPELDFDIDGTPRTAPPDLGAKQFTPLPPLCGTYTVGSAAADFPNLTEVITQLAVRGISCDVVFNLQNLNFNGGYNLNLITKTQPTNRVIFRNGNITSNFSLSNVGYVSFEDVTFSLPANPGVTATNTQNLSFKACEFWIPYTTNSIGLSVQGGCDSLRVDSCSFYEGTYDIWFSNTLAASRRGILIQKNAFYSLVQLSGNLKNAVVRQNYFQNFSPNPALHFENTTGKISVLKNKFNLTNTGNVAVGLSVFSHIGTDSTRLLIAENYVSTASNYAILTLASKFVDIYQNSLRSAAGNPTLKISDGCENIRLKNNLVSNVGGGHAIWSNNLAALSASDYNDFFAVGEGLGKIGTTDYSTLAAWQSATGKDAHSFSLNPMFPASPTDFNLIPKLPNLNGTGTDLLSEYPELALDIEEMLHTSPPDLGAKSFSPGGTPLCGTFTIGGATPDFQSFSQAADSMAQRGVGCNVVFHVRPGTYPENPQFLLIAKTAPGHTISFLPEPGTTDTVILSHAEAPLRVVGTNDLKFKKIGFLKTGTSTTSPAAANLTHAQRAEFDKCTFVQPISQRCIQVVGNCDSLKIKNCRLTAGEIGVRLDGGIASAENVQITDNQFFDHKFGVNATAKCPNLKIARNQLTSNSTASGESFGYSATTGFWLDITGAARIHDNSISKTHGTGILLWTTDPATDGLIADNFISIGTGNYKGIIADVNGTGTTNLDILHNTVLLQNNPDPDVIKNPFYAMSNRIRAKNNLFASFGNAPAMKTELPAQLISDYNDLFSQGTILVDGVGQTWPTLAAWQAAHGEDLHSLAVNPLMSASNPMLPTASVLNGAGIFLSGIPEILTDIAGAIRNNPPDIGVLEFGTAQASDLGVSAILSPISTCAGGGGQVFQIKIKNFGNSNESNFQLAFSSNGSPAVVENYTGATIPPGDSAVFAFSQNLSFPAAGNFNLKSWTIRPGDSQTANDTTSKTIEIYNLPTANLTATVPTTCPAAANGSLTFAASGGTAPYFFNLGNGNQSSGLFQNLAIGNYTVSVSDFHGCTKTASGTIGNGDVQPPVLANCPANQAAVLPCPSGTGQVFWTAPTASDNCAVASFSSNFSPGQNFPIGTTTVIYSAADVSGLTSNCSFTVSVSATADVLPPVLANCPASQNLNLVCGAGGQSVSWAPPTASDNCSSASLTSNFPPGTYFSEGTTVLIYTASDAAGNTATCFFSITLSENSQICTWLGGTGNFSNAGKWSCGVVPGGCDSAVVNSGTVNVDANFGVGSLKLTGGKLTVPAGSFDSIYIYNYFDWTGGTVEAPMYLPGESHFHGGNLILKRGFLSEGIIYFSSGTLTFGGSTEVRSMGDFVVSGTAAGFANQLSGNSFFNGGLVDFQKTGGSFSLAVPFENDNTVRLTTGFELKITRNFLGYPYSNIGFKNGSKISVLGSTTEFQFFANFTAAAGAFPQIVVNGGTALLWTDENYFAPNSKIEVLKGRWTASDPFPIGTLRLVGGTVDGNGILKTQFFDWSGGSLRTNLTMLGQGGKFAGGTGTLTKTLTHDGQKFDFLSGNIAMNSTAKFVNNSYFRHHVPAGSFLVSTAPVPPVQSDPEIIFDGAKPGVAAGSFLMQSFENHGVVQKDTAAAGAVAKFNVPFVNHSDGEFLGIGSVQFFGGLTQSGLLAPGLDSTAGTLVLTRDFDNQNGTLRLSMFQNGAAVSHDKLVGQRTVRLGGTLEIEEWGTLPDSSFEIISCGTPTGSTCRFDTFDVAVLPPDYSLVYENKRVLLVKDMMRPADERGFSFFKNHFSASPNPFSERAGIDFSLKKMEQLRFVVFDATGREVEILLSETSFSAGRHTVFWQPATSGRGVFFVKIFGKDFCETLRVLRI